MRRYRVGYLHDSGAFPDQWYEIEVWAYSVEHARDVAAVMIRKANREWSYLEIPEDG